MQPAKSIHIPHPCHASWSEMSETTTGRHCQQCDKVVRDFTGMDRAAVITEIENVAEPICGRVSANVLAPMPLDGVAIPGFVHARLRLFALAFVMTFGLEVFGFSRADAQTLQPTVEALRDTLSSEKSATAILGDSIVLQGKVQDVYTREPVAYAHVMAYAGDSLLAGTLSDEQGRFQLSFPQEKLTAATYELRLRYQGRERRDADVKRGTTELFYLIDASHMMEGITVTEQTQPFVIDPISFTSYSSITGMLVYHSTGSRTISRPLDEWLMMNFSEIHHSGRW